MNGDKSKLDPGIYILTCVKVCGYDEGFFWWDKGHQYRMQIKENGSLVMEAEGLLFVPTQERLKEILKNFLVEADFSNNVDVVKFFMDELRKN